MTLAKSKMGNAIKKFQASMKNTDLLKNKYVLYFILLLALADLFLFARAGEIFFIIVFIVFGLLISRFSQNMIIILSLSMILTNLVKYGVKMVHGNKEGMTNATIDIGELYENFTDEEKKYLKGVAEGNEAGLEGLTGNDEVIYESIIEYVKDKPNDEEENDDDETNDEDEIEEDDTGDAEGMRNKGKSGKKSNKKKKPKTIEGLEEEAQKLIKTQQNLKNNMEALEPMLKQAEKFMSQFEKTKK